ncbi:BTB/POZ domain-containing protein POB1-like [Actinia tenebrosa]|uniref:BTB/POZ domain-containing protein POB1-like n=1 Tax=Actinia tenebrosa TaxID=6105 RepID=A0A6P8I563_ACTTE|nr:BTB/POZ domain-containing protein POB1-like [Actinia tenebrosa]
MSSKIEGQANVEASMNANLMATDRVLEKIGDHYNNPEMADRILVVKVRPQGWEMQEAAKLARNYINKDKGKSEKMSNIESTNESKTSTRKNDEKSLSKVSKDVLSEPVSGAIASASIVLSDSDVDVEIVTSASDSSYSPVQEVYNSKAGTKRKKNNSEDSIVIPEEILLDKDSKCPIDSSCEQGSDLPNPSEVSKTEDVELKTENPVEESDREIISQADKKICVDIEEFLPIYTFATQQDVDSCVVCEHEIYVHSFWLALNSPYFRGLFFSSGMKETKDKKVVMNVSESMSSMFLVLIESLYRPEVVSNKSVDELLILMRLAHVYDTESTLKACERLLESADLSIEICDSALNMREHERLPEMDDFNKRCQRFLVDSFSPLDYQWTREEFFSLSAKALQSVLSSDELCVSMENTVFLALMRWAEVNDTYGDALESLLELVRFKAMTINYLHDIVTSKHPIAATVAKFPQMFEEAVFFRAFSKERQAEEGDLVSRKEFEEPILFNWHVENYDDSDFEKRKKIVKSPHFWVSGYEMFLELKLRSTGFQGLYLTICTRQFLHHSKGFVKLKYSLSSNFLKATHVFNEIDVFDKEGSGWGYEEFFPLVWYEFKEQLKRTPLIITAQVRLIE